MTSSPLGSRPAGWSALALISISFVLLSERTTAGFQVLPYVHIDYEHFYRLAQCQAQCTEKYGTVAYRRRLDGSTRAFFNVSNAQYGLCQAGCANARHSTKRAHSRSVADAFKDGQQFWLKAADLPPPQGQRRAGAGATTSASNSPSERSPIAALKLLCLRAASPPEGAVGYLDGFEALATALPHKVEFIAPVRYLVQWKQRVPLGKDGQFDETKWISAAIESDATFTVEGIQPGVHYRFMVTVIGVSGRMGAGVSSEWIEAPALGAGMTPNAMPMIITPQFNSDDNVSAVVSYRRSVETPSSRRSLPSTCSFHLRYMNVSQTVHTADFEMDESEGFLLTNLAFSADYEVQLLPRVVTASSSGNSVNIGSSSPAVLSLAAASTGRFRTIACADVFGPDSLQCEPEPVQDLDIQIRPENSTVWISWRPSVAFKHVLLYELRYESVANRSGECGLNENTQFLLANTTSAELIIPAASTQCEVEVHLTNFDTMGRTASITARFLFRAPHTPTSFGGIDASRIASNLWIVIVVPVVVIIALLLLLRFAAVGQRKLKKVVKPNGTPNSTNTASTTLRAPLVSKSKGTLPAAV
ncbi:Fibronectin type-III domain-containing protein [Aphelenchoides fujianensis]|nr:Fibronectin type-III domain-containing protein [Aphelenchoides fujianensis]